MIKITQNVFLAMVLTLTIVTFYSPVDEDLSLHSSLIDNNNVLHNNLPKKIQVQKSIIVENYFKYIDSLVIKYDSITPYKLTEHLLVRANLWIIDTLQNTDYYRMKARDSFVYNQKEMIVLPKDVLIIIPDSITAKTILKRFEKTLIDVNIPEFKLRIYEGSKMLYQFPVRVGRNEKKYLEMSGRIEDLKTRTGKGYIVDHVRNPKYANPVNNREYFVTKRDDERTTKLPQIPFIETEINGFRYGQLIHPTTNPITLEKAVSNGCIGTKEGDAWIIYYYAPISTKVNIRYNLDIKGNNGENVVLSDIYGYSKK